MQRREFLAKTTLAVLASSPRLAGSAPLSHADRWDSLLEDLQEQILPLMTETKVPGLSLVIIRDSKIAWQHCVGVRDTGSPKPSPIDADTMFEAASMSKPVFAYAVMKLCERGVLNLDTPLSKYTGRRLIKDDPRSDLITARHILSHTSGLQNWSSPTDPLSFHFQPGEKYSYSGEGYAYLQSVVTQLTSKPFETWMQETILTPFHMYSSTYVWNDLCEKRMTRGNDEHGYPMRWRKSTSADVLRYGAAGGLLTTPSDYARFLIEVVSPTSVDAFHLKGSSLEEMFHPQVLVAKTPDYTAWWGLGWRIATGKDGNTVIGHGGENPGFQCMSEISRTKKSGFVVMTNSENGPRLLGKLCPPMAQRLYSL